MPKPNSNSRKSDTPSKNNKDTRIASQSRQQQTQKEVVAAEDADDMNSAIDKQNLQELETMLSKLERMQKTVLLDAEQLKTVIRNKRKKEGLPPYSEEELEKEVLTRLEAAKRSSSSSTGPQRGKNVPRWYRIVDTAQKYIYLLFNLFMVLFCILFVFTFDWDNLMERALHMWHSLPANRES